MLGQLLESSPARVRRLHSTLVSVVGHLLVLSGAIAAARPVSDAAEPDTVIVWHPPAPPLPLQCNRCGSSGRPGASMRGQAEVPRGLARTLTQLDLEIPGNVEPVAPGVDISAREWQRGLAAARYAEGEGEPNIARAGVDREVVPLPTNPTPRYPATLRSAGIEGRVLARFVVDTTGRVVMSTLDIVAADHPAFAEAVIDALRRSRFTPAESRGQRVAQLVSQPFVFEVRE